MPDMAARLDHEPRADGRMLGALQRVTDAALADLSEDELLDELLRRVSEILGTDTAAVLLLDPEHDVLRPRAVHDVEAIEGAGEIAVCPGFAERVAAERRAVVAEDLDEVGVLSPALRDRGIRSLLGVPLMVGGAVTGVLHVGSVTPRRFSAGERDLLQLAADRAALAIEHANLLERERRARAAAEAASARLEALQRITDATLAYLPHRRLLDELLARICDILGADTAAVLLADEVRPILRARAARGIEEEVERGVVVPLGAGFAGRVAVERRPIAIEDLDEADIVNPLLREKGIRSLLGVPLLVEGKVLGVLHVGSLTPRRFTAGERDLLQLAADRAALAIEHANLFEQQQLAEALQRHLLPQDLDGIPGLEVATRYIPASRERLGGDWYDAFEVAPGEIVVAVGDVVGHGLAAAAVMAQLRTALRAYAAEGHPEGEVVERVNRLMCELGPDATTTLAYTVIETQHQRLRVVNAGHPPPLVLDPDGHAAFLPLQGGIPLGASPRARYHSAVHPFPTGSTLVLYTDGLVESRTEPIDRGLERLRTTATGPGGIETLCSRLIRRLDGDERADDVAVIAARVPRLPNPLSTRWPADRQVLGDVRQVLRRWLRERGLTDDEAYDIVVACGEACANAIEHAYRPGQHSFEVHAGEEDGRVRIEVRDRGRWREPRGVNRGRGLMMMRALMDAVVVDETEGGTRVVLERDLRAAAGAPR